MFFNLLVYYFDKLNVFKIITTLCVYLIKMLCILSDPVKGVDISFAGEDLEETDSEAEDENLEIEEGTSKASTTVPWVMDMDKTEGSVLNDQICLTYKQCILDLAQTPARNTCSRKGCGELLSIQQSTVGSALRLKWVGTLVQLCIINIFSVLPVNIFLLVFIYIK